MKELTETVTIQRKVDGRIADLVYFYKFVLSKYYEASRSCSPGARPVPLSDDKLIGYAKEFWDRQHGED